MLTYSTAPCSPKPGQPWWIFENMVMDIRPALGQSLPSEPTLIQVVDGSSATRGWAVYQPRGRIRARVFHRGPEPLPWNGTTARHLLGLALDRRRSIPGALPPDPTTMGWRLVFAEADFLPGLVMDVFGPVLVAQVNSAASEMVIRELVQHATELLPHLHTAVIRRDSPAREAEDLPIHQSSGWHSLGSHQEATAEGLRQPIPVRMDGGSVLLADVSSGQKTGLFLDQRLNRQLVAPLARGRTVLDMHCHVGGWSLALLAAGAQAALGVDASSQAVELARQSAVLPANQPFGRHAQFEHGDDSEWLKAAVEAGRKFEVVIIDPPALAKANRHVPAALRNHTSLARHALRLIPPGGFLVHACCSQAISPQQLDEALIDAAGREGISVHLIQRLSQPPDHPILLGHPASEYLKGVVLRRSG